MINYQRDIIDKHPWIIETNKNAVLSPDSDGFICGLFMSHFLNWKIVGFYDGKILVLKDGLNVEECVFLDVDIFRKNIKSIGHHMLLFNKNRLPDNWDNYDNCIQPNNIRNFDFKNDFKRKYPMGSIHLLLGILDNKITIDIKKPAICPLLFVDGTYKVLYSYPENVLDWIDFLGGNNPNSVLNKIFCNSYYAFHDLMLAMDNLFRARDKICAIGGGIRRERGDRLIISDNNGPVNLIAQRGVYLIEQDAKNRIEQFIDLISGLTEWSYKKDNWSWNALRLTEFNKQIGKPLVREYYSTLAQNPFSFAITAGDRFEYTLQ